MTPAEMLAAAADRIRDLAAVWEAENAKMAERRNKGLAALHAEYGRAYTWDEVAGFVVDEYSDKALDAGAAWIAALSPAIAPHLEVWLREVAGVWATAERKAEWQGYARRDPSAFVGDDDRAALEFARTVLGSGVDTRG